MMTFAFHYCVVINDTFSTEIIGLLSMFKRHFEFHGGGQKKGKAGGAGTGGERGKKSQSKRGKEVKRESERKRDRERERERKV